MAVALISMPMVIVMTEIIRTTFHMVPGTFTEADGTASQYHYDRANIIGEGIR
ncbi:MAG: hypothetical protein IPP38_10035 [Bacteroidetes bacterium]|nr:hypothetical protein [Bacteroidota bacterium]